jgi:hypothetical protein
MDTHARAARFLSSASTLRGLFLRGLSRSVMPLSFNEALSGLRFSGLIGGSEFIV